MTYNFSYDVFLSHNAKDKPRVRRLAERLKRAGLRVWFDEWNVRSGDIISLKVDEGLEHSRVLLLCISPNALASGWVALERSTIIHRDPSNEGRRFIPLLLADCDLPDMLRRYKYVDFREETEEAFAELLSLCRPAEPFPQREASLQLRKPTTKEELALQILCERSDLKRARWIGDVLKSAGYPVEADVLAHPSKLVKPARITALLLSKNTKQGVLQRFGREYRKGSSRLILLVFEDLVLPKQLQGEYSIAFRDDDPAGVRRLVIELSA